MHLDILKALNAERAARRAVIVVTNQDSGAQRLVKARRRRAAIRSRTCWRSTCAPARAASRRRRRARCSSPCTCRRRSSSSPARSISARRWRRSGRLLGYDVTIVDPRTAFASDRALSRRQGDRRMAGRGAAAARHRPLHGVRRADPRSQDRRPGALAIALQERLLLHRRARLAEDPRAPASSG